MALKGPLSTPRLLVAFFAVLLLYFYLRAPSDAPQPVPVSSTGDLKPALNAEVPAQEKSNGAEAEKVQGLAEPTPGQKEEKPEKDSMSDRFFDYLKGHSSHSQNSKSPVPHAEHAPQASASPKATTSKDPICAALPNLSDVLVVVRTPANDIYNHLPAHFLTDLRCVDFLLFSTVHQNIGPHTIHDALANISDSRRSHHKDFELYDKLQNAQNAVEDLSSHKEDNEHNLDRWTILPHVLSTYKMRPNKKWYVFIESDTYLSVSNLVPWLHKMDSNRPIYAGAPVMIGEVELAHSGSGIVLSNTAIEKLANRAVNHWDQWEEAIGNSCCGDKILAEALKESGVRLHRSFPMTQGETPFSLDWSERHWCRPAITWHRITPQYLDMLFQFETSWITKNAGKPELPPMLFKDYFKMFLVPLIRQSQNKTDWDNYASSLTYTDESRAQYAHYSFEACRAACDLRSSCVQYAWEPNKCRLGTVVKWGEGVATDKRMISGWHVQRVERFGEQVSKGVCPEDDVWILPSEHEEPPEPIEEDDFKEPQKDALQLEEEQIQAKVAEEQRGNAEKEAVEGAAKEQEVKEKALEEGMPKEESSAELEKAKEMAKDHPSEKKKKKKPKKAKGKSTAAVPELADAIDRPKANEPAEVNEAPQAEEALKTDQPATPDEGPKTNSDGVLQLEDLNTGGGLLTDTTWKFDEDKPALAGLGSEEGGAAI